ncbi:unnamed protein product [Rhodiola kirilowii]
MLDEVWAKTKSWKSLSSSQGGKQVLISGNKRVHWIKSTILRQPKGGLGFYNFKYLNLAFLTKQSWRIARNSTFLVSKILKAKYFPNSHILDARLTSRSSHVWRALHKSTYIDIWM